MKSNPFSANPRGRRSDVGLRPVMRWIAAGLMATALLGGACSMSGEDVDTAMSSSSSGDAEPTPPEESCARPGDVGNERGVGQYCTPLGRECVDLPGAPLCLADVGQDHWMCTRIGCDATTDCGAGAGCLIVEGRGSACVPCRCDNRGIGCDGSTGGADGGSVSRSRE